MPRNLSKYPAARLVALATLLAGATLASPAWGQSKVPPGRSKPAPAAASPAPEAASVADPRAQLWGMTAKYVYADDPALAKVSDELLRTVDDASLKSFNRSLDDAVRVEQGQYPKQNHVLKLLGYFKEIQAKNLPAANLPGLANEIQARLGSSQERMADPVRRQRLATFVAQLNQAAGAPGGAPGATSPATATATPTGAGASTADLVQVAEADTASPTPEVIANQMPSNPLAAPIASPSSSPMTYLSLLLSALSLVGVLFLLLTRNRAAEPLYRPEPEPLPPPRKPASDPLFSISQYQELQKLVRKEIAAAATTPVPARPAANQKQQAPRPAPAPAPKAAAAQAVPAAAPAIPPASLSELAFAEPATPAPATPPAPRVRTIYVNQQPLDGAFRRDNLADAPASYTIFEISVDEQSPDYGTFVVTRNEAAHGGYIGSHHSILEPACVYSYPQGPASRIITDTPGIVQRQPSGDWHISQKARIHFV